MKPKHRQGEQSDPLPCGLRSRLSALGFSPEAATSGCNFRDYERYERMAYIQSRRWMLLVGNVHLAAMKGNTLRTLGEGFVSMSRARRGTLV